MSFALGWMIYMFFSKTRLMTDLAPTVGLVFAHIYPPTSVLILPFLFCDRPDPRRV